MAQPIESPIKHTSGGEMPDTSRAYLAAHQIQTGNPKYLIPLLALGLGLTGLGGFFLWKAYRNRD